MTVAEISAVNRSLAEINPAYTAKFVRGDQVVDAGVQILLHGQRTRWGLQVGRGYVVVNECGFEDGELAWVQGHGTFRTIAAATAKLCALLRSDGR